VGGTCPGEAWCGLLGNGGSPSGSVTPVQVGGVSDFASVSAGYNHFCARRQNGQLLCWGENANGEAVPGGSARVTTPTLVQTGVARAEAGREGTCTVDLANVVRCWGVNDCHQRGPSDDNPTLAAELIPGYP
jgi:alpha-tubulin suppressor-like RCC1 family protein